MTMIYLNHCQWWSVIRRVSTIASHDHSRYNSNLLDELPRCGPLSGSTALQINRNAGSSWISAVLSLRMSSSHLHFMPLIQPLFKWFVWIAPDDKLCIVRGYTAQLFCNQHIGCIPLLSGSLRPVQNMGYPNGSPLECWMYYFRTNRYSMQIGIHSIIGPWVSKFNHWPRFHLRSYPVFLLQNVCWNIKNREEYLSRGYTGTPKRDGLAVLKDVDLAGLPCAYHVCHNNRNSGLLKGDSDVPHRDDIAGQKLNPCHM